MPRVLVVNNDRTIGQIVASAVEGSAVDVLIARSVPEGEAILRERPPDVLLLDVVLPKVDGLEMARHAKSRDARLPIVFVAGNDGSDMAIEAMKLGAYDYLVKPLDVEQVRSVIHRAVEARRLMQSPVQMECSEEPRETGDVLIGQSPQMLEVYKQIGRVAGQDVSVLIGGQSGTGKELVARAIYQHSHRAGKCFLAVNCAALPDTLLESELFGHEKGAFTSADGRHIGKFEQCNGGTIFLDEVGDMSLTTQSKVLRLLQEQVFQPVGGTQMIATDVRVISASNHDLEQMIDEGTFRLDLYYRLNTFEILLPPLRERGADIDRLIDYYLPRFNQQLGKTITGVAPAAMALLRAYSWPGNVRELQSVLSKAMLVATGPVVLPEFLPNEVQGEHPAAVPVGEGQSAVDFAGFVELREAAGSNNLYAECLEWMERRLISHVLEEAEGNQSKAAARLGITRSSLRHKLRTLRIAIDLVVSGM